MNALRPRLHRSGHLLAGLLIMFRVGPPHEVVAGVCRDDGSELARAALRVFNVPQRPRVRHRRGVL